MPETLGNLKTRILARADLENDGNISGVTGLLDGYVNASRKRLRRILVPANPMYFLKSASFTLAGSSYTYDLATNVTDFWKALGLDWVTGPTADGIVQLPRFTWRERDGSLERAYRVYTGTLEIRPATQAAGNYVFWYIAQPAVMSNDTTSKLDLAEDMWDEFIVLEGAIKARKRQQKNAADLESELVALTKEIQQTAADNDVGEPDRIQDTEGTRRTPGLPWDRLPPP